MFWPSLPQMSDRPVLNLHTLPPVPPGDGVFGLSELHRSIITRFYVQQLRAAESPGTASTEEHEAALRAKAKTDLDGYLERQDRDYLQMLLTEAAASIQRESQPPAATPLLGTGAGSLMKTSAGAVPQPRRTNPQCHVLPAPSASEKETDQASRMAVVLEASSSHTQSHEETAEQKAVQHEEKRLTVLLGLQTRCLLQGIGDPLKEDDIVELQHLTAAAKRRRIDNQAASAAKKAAKTITPPTSASEMSDSSMEDAEKGYNADKVYYDMNSLCGVGSHQIKWLVPVMKGLVGDAEYVDQQKSVPELVAEYNKNGEGGSKRYPLLWFREPELVENLEGEMVQSNNAMNVGAVIVHSEHTYTEIKNLNQIQEYFIKPTERRALDQGSWPGPRATRDSGPPPGVMVGRRLGVVYVDGICHEDSRTPLERLLYRMGSGNWIYGSNGAQSPHSTGQNLRKMILGFDKEDLETVLSNWPDAHRFSQRRDFLNLWFFNSLLYTASWSQVIDGWKDTTGQQQSSCDKESKKDKDAWDELKLCVAAMHLNRVDHKEYFPAIMRLPVHQSIDSTLKVLMQSTKDQHGHNFECAYKDLEKMYGLLDKTMYLKEVEEIKRKRMKEGYFKGVCE